MKKALFGFLFAAALLLPTTMRAQNAINNFPWTWDFSDSVASVNTWNSPDGGWDYFGQIGNKADGCFYTMEGTMISPAFAVPADAENFGLCFYIYGYTQYSNYADPALCLTVSTTGTDSANFTDTLFLNYCTTNGFARTKFELDSFAGNTIYLKFEAFSAGFFAGYFPTYCFIDDVKVGFFNAPEYAIDGSTYPIVGEANVYMPHYIDGDTTNGMNFTWTSVNGTVTPDGDNAEITYTAEGYDTITLIATNNYGSDTSIAVVYAIACAVDTLPYYEGFESPYAYCWQFVNNSENGTASWKFMYGQGYADYTHSGYGFIYSDYDSAYAADAWAISPAIHMPANAEGVSLVYYVMTQTWQGIVNSYDVRISTSGNDVDDFTTVLLTSADSTNNAEWAKKVIDLSSYAGQTIYIAFHNFTAADGNLLFIDDIEIRSTNAPVFETNIPEHTQTGFATTLTATYVEGNQNGMTYSWTSTMVDAGQATITNANTTNATITYTAAGTDHITFTATNAYGSYTSEADVEVVECSAITNIPWNYDFTANQGIDACWTTIDADGDGENWVFISGWGMYSYSYDSDGETYEESYDPDNWLVTPRITLPQGASYFNYTYKNILPNYPDHFGIFVSTTGLNPADFTMISEVNPTDSTWHVMNVDLSRYAGQTVFIAIRHFDSYDNYGFAVSNVSVTTTPASGINEVAEANVSVYPNPTNDVINVKGEGISLIEVMDVNGRTVATRNNAGTIDLSDFAAGVYMVRTVTTDGVATKRIVKN